MEGYLQHMELTPGLILDGTVKSIAAFGAFVSLPEGRTGLVHISEVASRFVSDVGEHLQVGQPVRVKVLSIDPGGKLRLSIKQAEEKPAARPAQPVRPAQPAPQPDSFEEKLKRFMAASNDKISGVRQYEHRTKSRKR